jgi:hypothetical protein
MAIVIKPFTFSAGATIIAAEHNSNFDTLYNLVNGNLDTNNLSPTANITSTQLAGGGSGSATFPRILANMGA